MTDKLHDQAAIDAAFAASGYVDREAFDKFVVPALLAYANALPKISGEEGLWEIEKRRSVYSDSSEEAQILDVAIATIKEIQLGEAISESNSAYNYHNIEVVSNFLLYEVPDYEILDGVDDDPLGSGKTIVAHFQKLYQRISDLEDQVTAHP